MLKNDLINDATYLCGTCGGMFMAYTEGGDTNFSPCCGCRISRCKGVDEDED
jgi:hypothetical protein